MKTSSFKQVWLIDFEFRREPGEAPTPVGFIAIEAGSGRELRGEQERWSVSPPFSVGPDSLLVVYDAPAQIGCFLALDWPLPANVLDLHAEFRCLTSGLDVPDGYDLQGALAHFGLGGHRVGGMARLYDAMLPRISVPHALLRGRYTAAVARMEAIGTPIDVESLTRLRQGWDRIRDRFIGDVDQRYGVYQRGKFNPKLWGRWLNRNRIRWPRLSSDALALDIDTFREMAMMYPAVGPMKELRATLALLRPSELPVGQDGRNRAPIRPFAAKTGRNAPSTTKFIFGPATWLRGLIKPPEGMAVAYIDYEQQEFGIAAALSGDRNMIEAYMSGDPYLAFAKQARAVPSDATKNSHCEVRERFKHCALGVQYGMGPKSLAIRLGITDGEAKDLILMHKRMYATYWRWTRKVLKEAKKERKLQSIYGWTINVHADSNPRSLNNFPLQANGAEMLRLSCIFLTERGVRVCAPVHDALLIEAEVDAIESTVAVCQQEMERASLALLQRFPLRTEASITRWPDRYMDRRGRAMWNTVNRLLDECCTPATPCCS